MGYVIYVQLMSSNFQYVKNCNFQTSFENKIKCLWICKGLWIKKMQKSMGWKVNGTALNNFGWIGNVNVQYLLDPDHNQSLRLK